MGSLHSGTANLVRSCTQQDPDEECEWIVQAGSRPCAISGGLRGWGGGGGEQGWGKDQHSFLEFPARVGKISIPFWSLQLIFEERT